MNIVEFIQEYMPIARVPPLFGTDMQLKNEFHLQPNSCLARVLDCTRDVTPNHGKKRWVIPLSSQYGVTAFVYSKFQ